MDKDALAATLVARSLEHAFWQVLSKEGNEVTVTGYKLPDETDETAGVYRLTIERIGTKGEVA